MATLSIDESFLRDTLNTLIRTNSINPTLAVDAPGEGETAVYVANTLRQMGLDVTHYEVQPGRPNVVGRLVGNGNGRSLLLNAHMDTVGVDGMTIPPFDPILRDGNVYGRGTQDMKGSLAAMLAAVKALVDADVKLAGDVLLTAVCDEEYSSIGSADLVTHPEFHADAAIVTEPTDLAVCRAHRGYVWYNVETFGRAAHGSRFQDGIDANMRMGRFLAELDKLEQELRQRPPHPLAGPPSLHAARLQGGSEISIYAAHCLCQIERRTMPGETEAQATAELQAIVDRLSAADDTFRATVTPFFQREPFASEPDSPIAQAVTAAAAQRLGHAPAQVGQPFWTDAALFAAVGMDAVLIGPIGGGLHSAVEWVDLASVMDLAAILAETAVRYCGSN
ncbi:MAG: ArgE/DapE family deacylase [Ardenticatenaceae bacterium]|nr:ArgE/DapE family deacylase [Ardenticatenaceae bacterium]MCB8989029.1 ArgE/DapE family deacylase [Ardenticatenaceae bacterium]